MVTGQHDPTRNITVTNNWKKDTSVVLGCKCHSDDYDGITPYYISPPRVIGENVVLIPVQSFSVLFATDKKVKDRIDFNVTKGKFGRFEITQGETDCHVKYDTTILLVNNHWTSVMALLFPSHIFCSVFIGMWTGCLNHKSPAVWMVTSIFRALLYGSHWYRFGRAKSLVRALS